MWRSVTSVKVILQPGDQHNVKVDFQYNRRFYYREFQARSEQYLAGITIFPMVIQKGGLVGLSLTGLDGSATEVANGSTKVGYATNFRYNLAALPPNRFTVGAFFPGNVETTTDYVKQIDDVDNVDIKISINGKEYCVENNNTTTYKLDGPKSNKTKCASHDKEIEV